MKESTRARLCLLAEGDYKDFAAALIPGEENILGIRLPLLREIAKELAKGNWTEELLEKDVYFEETMLRGMMIGYATLRMEPAKALSYISDFIPLVHNWSVCDSVFMKMDILKKDRELTWEFLLPYMKSGEEYKVRVALIIMMAHLLRCDRNGKKISRVRNVSMEDIAGIREEEERAGKYIALIFEKINRPFSEGYYAQMAAAWLVAESFCCFPALTNDFLKDCMLDDFTYNKALQKITESKIPQNDVKAYIRSCKRQKN